MAYPVFYPFKTRSYFASSTSSNTVMSVAIPARAKYITAYYATSTGQAQTAAANTADIYLNGSVIISSGVAVTTSTGNGSTQINQTNTSVVYINAGDVLSTVLSSCVGGVTTYVIQEF